MKDYPTKNKYLGNLAFILHAHLPYVRKNEKNSLEEDWFFQAVLECYIPLIRVLEESIRSEPDNSKLTISLSPTLITLFQSSELQGKFPEWINTRIRLLEELPEDQRNASKFLLKNMTDQLSYWEKYSGNLIHRFKYFLETGCLDIITCAATHGYLPILRENPETVSGQIKTAIRHHQSTFNVKPLGIWLPECAYYENLDQILNECGIRYAVLDGHGILNSKPRPRYGVYAPICSKNGVAFFGRDSQSTLPVWSAKEGFPGDASYREYHKDLGWELPLNKLKEHGISSVRPLGLKLYRITDNAISLGEKEFYKEKLAEKKAEEHAISYLSRRSEQLRKLNIDYNFNPILIAPFDAELFGHWWYEGPIFLRNIFKHSKKHLIKLTHLREILSFSPQLQVCEPSPSSWGQGGFHNYWLNDTNAWIVPEITKAGSTFVEINSKNIENELSKRILMQAARELLLSESSDWSFILRAGTTTDLAKERIQRHLSRFWKLIRSLNENESIDLTFLENVEKEDKIFPNINLQDWFKNIS